MKKKIHWIIAGLIFILLLSILMFNLGYRKGYMEDNDKVLEECYDALTNDSYIGKNISINRFNPNKTGVKLQVVEIFEKVNS